MQPLDRVSERDEMRWERKGGREAGGERRSTKCEAKGGCPPFPAEQSLSIVNMHAGVGGWVVNKVPQSTEVPASARGFLLKKDKCEFAYALSKYDAQEAATNCGPPLRQSDVGSVRPLRASVKTEDMTDYRNMRICRPPSQEYVLERQAGVAVVTSTLFSSP